MKNLSYLDEHRVPLLGNIGDECNGAFEVKIKGEKYYIVVSNALGWEHVSISHKHKIPSWSVMCIVKDMFFKENETVMQLHVAKKNYVNIHPNCLHLWRPIGKEVPTPPVDCV